MTVTMFGISNCDTIKKAKKWLDTNNIAYTFHDYRKNGLTESWLAQAESQLGWEVMVNKRGTTYRALSDDQKASLNQTSALALMLAQEAVIKRPILDVDGTFHIGFKPAQYEEIFA